jgi:hypothetical protein
MGENEELFVSELKAIIACGQSDGLLKNWAYKKLSRIEAGKRSPVSRWKKTLTNTVDFRHLLAVH